MLHTYIDKRKAKVSEWAGFTAYFLGMYKGECIPGRGEAPGAVVSAGGSWKIVEGHVRIYFRSSKGAVVTGIWQAWWG